MNHAGAWTKTLALVATASLFTGCYRYVPTDASVAPPGQNVRVLVTRLGAAELSEVVPTGAVSGSIAGQMQGMDGDDLLLAVPVGERREGFMTVDLKQTIRVPMGEVLGMERRELDPAGTGFLLVGAAALGAVVVLGIMEAFGSAPGPDDGEPPVDFTFHLGSLPLPWGR